MLIEGPNGAIEANLRLVEEGNADFAILCHPHPLYGGSMHDTVLSQLDSALESCSVSSLRFNFRGVGASAGDYDGGEGESDDLVFLCEWLRNHHDVKRLIIGGYSFGGVVALSTLPRVSWDSAILVAPAISMLDSSVTAPEGKVLAILGSNDDFVDVDQAKDWFSGDTQVEVLEGTDHFFFGVGGQINEYVHGFVAG